MDKVENLAEFVRRQVNEKNLNYRQVALRSRGFVSHSTVYDIINGRNLNPSIKVLRGLAVGLGVTEEEITSIARGKQPNSQTVEEERFKLIGLKFLELEGEDKRDVEGFIQMLERELERKINNRSEQ